MRILFIIPPYLPFDEYQPKKAGLKLPVLTPPYGVLSIISYINQNKEHDIEIFDMNYYLIKRNADQESIKKILSAKLKLYKMPNIIGISALFNTCFPHLKYICKICKDIRPSAPILVGGGLATNLYEDLFKEIPEIDYVCYGEGELPLDSFLYYQSSPAWITKESLSLGIKPQYDFIYNLDNIPIIDFSYIDLTQYNGRSYINRSPDKIEMSIHTSRGCPYNCCFCSNGKVHGKKIRIMSDGRVVKTVQEYRAKYNLDILMIEDDHFLYDKERAVYLLNEFKKLDIDIEFPNGIAVYQVDDDIAKAFHDSAVKVVPLAIESCSDYVLKEIIDKPLTKEKIYKAVNALKKYDILIHAFVIIGFPHEMPEHRKETLDTLVDLGIDWVHVFIVVPIAGSRLYEQCKTEGFLLSEDYNDYTVGKCNIKAPGVEPEDIEEYAYYMNAVVNYIENTSFKNGRYERCLPYFRNVANRYPNNAIAHFMLSKIHDRLYTKLMIESKFYQKIRDRLIVGGLL